MATKSTAAFSIPTAAERHAFEPPAWTEDILLNVPQHGRLQLANLPTPLYQITAPTAASAESIMGALSDLDITLFVKRDDATHGVELGGNKLRKLEFLLADALANGHDSVVTIGGEQSNHCRATAAASRMVGMEPHLILRTKRADAVQDGKEEFGLVGNVLLDRMVGSSVYTCTPGEYGRVGSDSLVERLCKHLGSDAGGGKKPYPIPVGGSNGIGSWGYVKGANELLEQWSRLRSSAGAAPSLDHVVFACGSGGTAAGIAVGIGLGTAKKKVKPTVHAVGVCDDEDYFYGRVSAIADEMGLVLPSYLPTEEWVKEHMTVHQGKGKGYAASTPEELQFVAQFARETGIVLDPVYSGKALYHFVNHIVKDDPESFRGRNILFWHTGGALGLYDKGDALASVLEASSPVKRLDVYGKGTDNTVSI